MSERALAEFSAIPPSRITSLRFWIVFWQYSKNRCSWRLDSLMFRSLHLAKKSSWSREFFTALGYFSWLRAKKGELFDLKADLSLGALSLSEENLPTEESRLSIPWFLVWALREGLLIVVVVALVRVWLMGGLLKLRFDCCCLPIIASCWISLSKFDSSAALWNMLEGAFLLEALEVTVLFLTKSMLCDSYRSRILSL